NPFVFGEQCRIKHLPTQQYISVKDTLDGSKLVVEGINEANGAELFKILSTNIAPQEEVCIRDQVVFQHVNSQKFLGVNVKPILKKRHLSQQDHLSQWFNLMLDDKEDDSTPIPVTSHYEILKAEEGAVLDIYHVTGLSSCLCYHLKRVSLFTTEDELDAKRALQLSSLYQDVMTQMIGLKVAFNASSNKKRLANMLRTLQTIDAMIALLLKIASGTSSPLKHEVCCSICSALEEYVENSNIKSRHYLAKNELLKSLMTTVGKEFGTEKILITLSKDDVEIGDLLQKSIISFIETLNTEDPKVAELMTALVFSGRKFNKEIQSKIYERTLATGMVHNHNANSNVQQILAGYVETVGSYFEKFGINIKGRSFTYSYHELLVNPNEKIEFIIDDEQKNVIFLMKKSLHEFLSTNEMHLLYTGDEYKGRNSIIAQVLGILVFLVDFGVYNTDDEVALQSLNLLLQQHFRSSVKALLYDFKHIREKLCSNEEEISPDTVEENVSHSIVSSSVRKFSDDQVELQEIAILSKEESEFIEPPISMKVLFGSKNNPNEKLCAESLARLRFNFRSQVYLVFDIDSTNCQNLPSILLDLISYDDSDVCLLSANILFEVFEVENILLSKAKDAYFTTPDTNQKIHEEMKKLSSMTDSDQLLKQMLRNQIQDKQKLLNKLDELSNCFVSSNDESEPDSSNQGVAYSCGLFNILMEFVLEYGNLDQSQCHEDVFSSCFTVLQRITRKNIRAQNKLFESFNDFIEIKTAVASMTCLLSEVFSNNPSLCKRLSENDIRKLFFMSIRSSNPEHYELTVTLQTIIQNTEPATPLQEYISQLFLHHWQDNLGHILGQENQAIRFQLLENADDEDPHLQLLLNITDLLASCTVGECQFAEPVSQHFYNIDELLLILANEKIVSHHKLPFVRLLTWTFLNTERDSALACSQLASSRATDFTY
uniref:Uncharacterized protein n=1 Tax=Amphimedon queenslandica TaxID=400682 RepID=A0A1X7TEF3_AMPQE